VGRLHLRETAGKLGEKPTGNARCLNYHYQPIVRMTNTWIERGTTPVKELFSGIKTGVYAQNWQGGMTNGEMFTFGAGKAWMICDGEIAEPVKDVTLSGNVFKTLANIEAIGDDFYWDESGGCGKGGQSGLPVGCGSQSPHPQCGRRGRSRYSVISDQLSVISDQESVKSEKTVENYYLILITDN
jgi:TldD protein